ncbi:hypothetical protein HK101_004385 [Irineochytrium annulatum]|nr:hypothetical protein HK101_004385 [Irineochytrium annulatum]
MDPDNDSSSEQAPSTSTSDRAKRLKMLSRLRDQSKEANRKDVLKEHQNSKRNPREEARAEKKRRGAEIEKMRLDAEEAGMDYERVRAMNYSVQDVERYEKKEKSKAKRADTGFTDYAQIAAKKYKKMVKEIKPNLREYEEQRREAEDDDQIAGPASSTAIEGFYRDAKAITHASAAHAKPSDKVVDKLVKVIEKDVEKRKNFSRRRRHNEDDDITYINERNMRFNQKISRAYDKHTAEIKAAFERGTAL